MFCPKCGAEIPDNALFCPNCGENMQPEEVPQYTQKLQEFEETEIGGGNVYEEPYYKNEQPIHNSVEKKSIVVPIVLGVVIVLLVAGIGVAGVWLYNTYKGDDDSYVAPKIVSAEEAEKTTETNEEDTEEEKITVEPKEVDPKDVTASLVNTSSADLKKYQKATCSSTSQSSMIFQEGLDNSAKAVLDGRDDTSWQEGVDGDGLGENLSFSFSKEYSVKYITFKLGNWRDNQYFASNNRPKTLEITLGDDFKTTVTFPDSKEEFCLELSDEVKAKKMTVTVSAVYKGAEWDDTCINEITVYGK